MGRISDSRLITRLHHSPTVARVRMLQAAPRLARSDDRVSHAIASAARTTALGRIPAGEQGWLARIESRREGLMTSLSALPAGFETGRGTHPDWITRLNRPIQIGAATWALSVPPFWGCFLMRLVGEIKPRACLELGTGLGISAAYQAASLELSGSGGLTTLDGATEWMRTAEEGFSALGLTRVGTRTGQISDTLGEVLDSIAPIDYAFVDAEHQEAATLDYFEAMLDYLSGGATVVFDDIRLDGEMRRVWRSVSRHPRISTAVDIGRFGIVVAS